VLLSTDVSAGSFKLDGWKLLAIKIYAGKCPKSQQKKKSIDKNGAYIAETIH
jgi:hypothetical protein